MGLALVSSRFFAAVISSSFDDDTERAWKTVGIVPAVFGVAVGAIIYVFSEDTPQGNVWERRRAGTLRSWPQCFEVGNALLNYKIWILFFQLFGSQGVMLTMRNAAALLFFNKFGVSTVSAAAVVNVSSWIEWPLQVLGGFLSDLAYHCKLGTKGRVLVLSLIHI